MPKKQDPIAQFAEIDILKSIEPKLLLRFLKNYRGFFEQQGIHLPDDIADDEELPFSDYKDSILSVEISEVGTSLARALMSIISIQNVIDYDLVSEQLANLEQRYSRELESMMAGIATQGNEGTISKLGRVISIYLLGTHGEKAITELAAFSESQYNRGFREFPMKWEEDEETNPTEGLLCADKSEIDARMPIAAQDIEKELAKHKIRSQCKIIHTVCQGNLEWFFIEYGGSLSRIESKGENGLTNMISLYPLKRDIVFFDKNYKVLSVKGEVSWKEELYRQVFGKVLFDDDSAFLDQALYTLEPLYKTPLGVLLSTNELSSDLLSVKLIAVDWFERDGDEFIYHKVSNKKVKGLHAYWKKNKDKLHNIQSATFALKFRGRSSAVNATLKNKRGLNIIHTEYKAAIRKFLRRKGFEVKRYVEISGDNNEVQDNIFALEHILRKPEFTIRELRNHCGDGLSKCLRPYLAFTGEANYLKEWFDCDGTRFEVNGLDGIYKIYNPEFHTQGESDIDLDPHEVELVQIDVDKLVTDLSKVLLQIDRKKTRQVEGASGCYRLSEYHPCGLQCWMYLPLQDNDESLTILCHTINKTDGSHAILGFSKECPERFKPILAEFNIQWMNCLDVLELTHEGEWKLASKNQEDTYSMADYLVKKRDNGVDGRFWSYPPPETKCWNQVSIKLDYGQVWIRYGTKEHTYKPESLEMFNNSKVDTSYNENFILLAKLIKHKDESGEIDLTTVKKGGVFPDNVSSQLTKLSLALSRFFGIQDTFYECKKKKYTLKFASCTSELIFSPVKKKLPTSNS